MTKQQYERAAMNTPDSYRIVDEGESVAETRKAPWPPRALFFLTILFAPLGALLWAFNWGRLGVPEKRAPWLALALLAGWVLPIVVIFNLLPVRPDSHSKGTVLSVASLILAWAFRSAQSSRQQWHELQGGKTANPWPIWAFLGVWLALLFGPSLIGSLR